MPKLSIIHNPHLCRVAGIYIHIPFCKQACHYCNFYFSTSTGNKQKVLDAINLEIEHSKNYLAGETIHTIYFGGGTPSILTADELKRIIENIHRHHHCDVQELTLEANPDDLTTQKVSELAALKAFGLNRFSIGVQSFFNEDLQYMNRAHSRDEAISAIQKVQDAGFDLLTIDLIYGTPTTTNEHWLQNLETAFGLHIPHLSCYALTVEPQTSLHQKIKKKLLPPVDENLAATHFDILKTQAEQNGFEHYEISNFALPGKHALHNTNYWRGVPYIGIGPSAHSFNGHERRWNVSNNLSYVEGINTGKIYFETETLTPAQQANEYIMTSLRTMWGMNLNHEKIIAYQPEILQSLRDVNTNFYWVKNETVVLTKEGKHFADGVAGSLFVE